jgi:hypothetical protein
MERKTAMTVTDEAKLFAIRTQLLEMRFKLDASINIINYVFERSTGPSQLDTSPVLACDDSIGCDPITGLYPGQISYEEIQCEEADSATECLE